MNRPYILVEAYPGDLAYEVTKRIEEGYVPVGGPFQGKKGISEHYLLQAMFNERYVEIKRSPVGMKMPTSQDLDDSVYEANARHPGSASRNPPMPSLTKSGIFGFACEEDRVQWESDHAEIRKHLEDKDAFIELSEGKCEAVLNSAKRIFHRKITHLRQLQQTPYMQHREPTNNADRIEMIHELMACGDGVMEEYFAGERARDPWRVADILSVKIDVRHAQKISALLDSEHTLTTRAQYPTELQDAIYHFQDAINTRRL